MHLDRQKAEVARAETPAAPRSGRLELIALTGNYQFARAAYGANEQTEEVTHQLTIFRLTDPQSCQERALECERLARVAPGPASRTMFAEIAVAWRRAADLAKTTEPPLDLEPLETEVASTA